MKQCAQVSTTGAMLLPASLSVCPDFLFALFLLDILDEVLDAVWAVSICGILFGLACVLVCFRGVLLHGVVTVCCHAVLTSLFRIPFYYPAKILLLLYLIHPHFKVCGCVCACVCVCGILFRACFRFLVRHIMFLNISQQKQQPSTTSPPLT